MVPNSVSKVRSEGGRGGSCTKVLGVIEVVHEGCGSLGIVGGPGGAKVSCPMSSVMSESVDPVGRGVDEVRLWVGQV